MTDRQSEDQSKAPTRRPIYLRVWAWIVLGVLFPVSYTHLTLPTN